MLHINQIRDNSELIIKLLSVKNFDAQNIVKEILLLDEKKRSQQKLFDDTQAELNRISKEVGILFKSGKQDEAQLLKEKTVELKNAAKEVNDVLSETGQALEKLLVKLPNIPHSSVRGGKSSEDNEIIYSEGNLEIPKGLLPHWELCQKYDIIDFELGTKISGSGFPVYKGKGARLQRALIDFFIDNAVEAGYIEIQPPIFVNSESAFGTGQLPDKDSQMYYMSIDNLYAIPTAEVPVTNLYRDLIFNAQDLPVKNVAYTPCFRREAGSYGKDVRGLNRLHQFDKVEIVQIQLPEKSYETLEEMRTYVCGLLRLLNLPFRVLKLCGGDISFTSALTYDMEVYSKGQQRWLEVSSVSNFETFQANRMKIRYRAEANKTQTLHTLNGSALALPRIVASLLENNQTPDGIIVPECLIPYTKFSIIN
ncbi:MAG: serine--tRNA ligase [Bacteroidales bacterium]|nr:serine--tRNA ligase [Bacteroidales bacterium]